MALVQLRNVSVEFPVYQGYSRSLKKSLLRNPARSNLGRDLHERINVRALNDLTLDLRDGDRLGLIGANGAGKSTLLKVMAGIYKPTRGGFHSIGRASALLDVTAGMDMEATGRENIILRGMYMGFHPREMRRYVDDIVEFTELGDYIDMPLRVYSSGMMVRLAFGIATAIAPEILIMDEWLAAGDDAFLERAYQRMAAFARRASILVLATHILPLVREWCNRGLLLDKGNVGCLGPVDEAINAYRRRHGGSETETSLRPAIGGGPH